MLDPSGSMYHYETELASAVSALVPDFSLFSSTRHRDPGYPGPSEVVPRRGFSLEQVGLNSGARLLGVSGFTVDYFINEGYFLAKLLAARPRPLVHIQFLSFLYRSGLDLRYLRAVKKLSSGLVYTVHNVLPHDAEGQPGVIDRYRTVYELADRLIVHTHSQYESVVGDFGIPAGKVAIIPHGPLFHRLPLPRSDEARRLLQLDERPVLLHFGQMRPYKGTEILLAALPALIDMMGPVMLVLAGPATPVRAAHLLDLIDRHGLREFVRTHLAYVPTQELAPYLAAADVAVMPYLRIDQSGVLLTLMSLGVPVVASSVEGVLETLGTQDRGYVYEPNTPSALAETLYTALTDSERTRGRAERARRYTSETLSWDRIAADTVSIYHQVMEA